MFQNFKFQFQQTFKPLMQRADPDNPPKWLKCNKPMIPDMLAIDPIKMPVWEITGAQFSKSDIHTAAGISIRFPRITKQRDDKSYNEATSLNELKNLFEASKDCVNLQLLTDGLDDADIDIKTKLQGGGDGGSSGSPRKPILTKTLTSPSDVKSVQKRDRSEDNNASNTLKKIKSTKDNSETKKSVKPNNDDDDDEKSTKIHKKVKPKYLFNDSTEDEDDAVTEKKIKIPDNDNKMKNIANSHVVKEKTREKQIIAKKASCVTTNTVATTTPSSSSSSSFTTTSSVAVDGAVIDTALKNKEITEKQQQFTSNDNIGAKNSHIKIFENIFLHVPDNELRDCLKEELRYFHLWGGTELSNSNECTHVLHKNSIIPNENCYSIRLV